MKTHKDLEVWKRAMNLVTWVYQITRLFPKEELFGLTGQMRRAAVSVPSNMAEGCGRGSKKELVHFLYIALGSLSELETQFIISRNLEYIAPEILQKVEDEITAITRMLTALIKSNS